ESNIFSLTPCTNSGGSREPVRPPHPSHRPFRSLQNFKLMWIGEVRPPHVWKSYSPSPHLCQRFMLGKHQATEPLPSFNAALQMAVRPRTKSLCISSMMSSLATA